MHSRLAPLRSTVGRRPHRGTRTRVPPCASIQDPERDAAPARAPNAPLPDHGIALLVAFTASALLIVVLVVVAAAIGTWWILVPLMTIDLTVTLVVLTTVARLLDEAD